MFFGVSENDIAMSEFGQPQIQQIFIIEKGSGLIIASFSKSDTIDEDMIAGMLTAIKSFVEDAFQGGNQSLENIEYELNTIQIQNFQSYYMAAVISGAVDTGFKSDLQDRLLDFANDKTKINFENKYLIEEKLETFFKNE